MGSIMDMGNSTDTGASTDRTTPPLRKQPITEYLRHVSRAEQVAERDVVLSIPRKLYRASEIAQHLAITRQTVHNYATIGLITEEARTPGGQRLFDESVFPRLFRIHRLKRTHRLHEIRRILDEQERRGPHVDDVAHASDMADGSGSAARDPQMKDTRRARLPGHAPAYGRSRPTDEGHPTP